VQLESLPGGFLRLLRHGTDDSRCWWSLGSASHWLMHRWRYVGDSVHTRWRLNCGAKEVESTRPLRQYVYVVCDASWKHFRYVGTPPRAVTAHRDVLYLGFWNEERTRSRCADRYKNAHAEASGSAQAPGLSTRAVCSWTVLILLISSGCFLKPYRSKDDRQ
jgi:hypothetical protein